MRSGRSLIGPSPRPIFRQLAGSWGQCERWPPWVARVCLAGKAQSGGEGEIRTHGTVARSLVFETSPIGHSGTSPLRLARPIRKPPSSFRQALTSPLGLRRDLVAAGRRGGKFADGSQNMATSPLPAKGVAARDLLNPHFLLSGRAVKLVLVDPPDASQAGVALATFKGFSGFFLIGAVAGRSTEVATNVVSGEALFSGLSRDTTGESCDGGAKPAT